MNNAHNTTVATLRTIHCSVGLECQFGLLNRSEHREQRTKASYLFLLLMQTILYSVYGEAIGLWLFLHRSHCGAVVVETRHLFHTAHTAPLTLTSWHWRFVPIHAHRSKDAYVCIGCSSSDFTIKYRVRATNTVTYTWPAINVLVLYTKFLTHRKMTSEF